MTLTVTLALVAFLISLLGTRLLIFTLRHRKTLLDIPNPRSNHRRPVPRGGGVAVIFAMMICMSIADLGYDVMFSVFLLAAISLLDDVKKISPFVRLLVHLLAVIIPLSTINAPIFGGWLPEWLDKAAAALCWVWFINLFNFMDGIDGISATETITIGVGLSLVLAFSAAFPSPLATYGLIAAAAATGFLWWNWHPAKIFLGDVGSVPIGFVMGYLLLLAAISNYPYAAIILPGYYLADGTITLFKRLYQGKKIWVGHSEHYYQQAVRRGRSHGTVTRYIAGMNMLLIFLSVQSALEPDLAGFHVVMGYLSVLMLLGYFAHANPHPHHDNPQKI